MFGRKRYMSLPPTFFYRHLSWETFYVHFLIFQSLINPPQSSVCFRHSIAVSKIVHDSSSHMSYFPQNSSKLCLLFWHHFSYSPFYSQKCPCLYDKLYGHPFYDYMIRKPVATLWTLSCLIFIIILHCWFSVPCVAWNYFLLVLSVLVFLGTWSCCLCVSHFSHIFWNRITWF